MDFFFKPPTSNPKVIEFLITIKTNMLYIQNLIYKKSINKRITKEFKIFKRKTSWLCNPTMTCKQGSSHFFKHIISYHKAEIQTLQHSKNRIFQRNKKKNIKLAIKKVDKITIKPGETFSMWQTIGRPTKSKGYQESSTIQKNKIVSLTGGGIYLIGNLLFNMFNKSPLDITEKHKLNINNIKSFNESLLHNNLTAISYNTMDLQVKNNTNNIYQLKLWVDEDYLKGELLSRNPV